MPLVSETNRRREISAGSDGVEVVPMAVLVMLVVLEYHSCGAGRWVLQKMDVMMVAAAAPAPEKAPIKMHPQWFHLPKWCIFHPDAVVDWWNLEWNKPPWDHHCR